MQKRYCAHCIAAARPIDTTVCRSCSHQYGAFRERCPACGTANEKPKFNTPRESAPRVRRERPEHPTKCVFCQRRGAKSERCSKCSKPVHPSCKPLHESRCGGAA